MRIAFLTPTHQSTARGNTVTVNRWLAGLRQRGHEVVVLENNERDAVISFAPDILHAHHAVHCGPTAISIAQTLLQTKVVISLGGTDLHGPTGSPEDAGRKSLASANAIVGPFEADGKKLAAAFPECSHFHVVPRGVSPKTTTPKAISTPIHGVMVGGIRFVKGSLAALEWRSLTAKRGLDIRLDFAGPIIEADYGARFQELCSKSPETRYLGELSPDATATLMQEADFLLNFSESEGASNAILEALAAGKPVAARAVPGNIALLRAAPPEIAHLIETDHEGFDSWFSWLQELSKRSPTVTHAKAQDFVASQFSCEAEIDALLKVYQSIVC